MTNGTAIEYLLRVAYSGKPTDSKWDALKNAVKEAKVEIKDGAIIQITTDSNNDGTINANDNLPSVKNNPKLMKVNSNDDNQNSKEDLLERPPRYDTPRNQMAASLGKDYQDVDHENDLVETQFYVWIDTLKSTVSDKTLEIDVYAISASGNLIMWTHPTKGKHLHYGHDVYEPRTQNRIDEQRRLVTLKDGNTQLKKTVSFEATSFLKSTATLVAEVYAINPSNKSIVSQLSVASDTAYYEVVESNWTVTRNNGATAPAISGHGDTIFNLANDIGLDPREFKNWLTITSSTIRLMNGTSISSSQLKIDDKLYGGQQFQIPNTISMAWFGEGGDLGKKYMQWENNISNLRKLGFAVSIFDNDSFSINERFTEQNMPGYGFPDNAKVSFLKQVNQLSSMKTLHGMYMMGHGSTSSVGSEGWQGDYQHFTCVGPLWNVSYGHVPQNNDVPDLNTIGGNLKYRLGTLIIQACESNESNARSGLLSHNGIFHGESGTYMPVPMTLSIVWGYQRQHNHLYDLFYIDLYGGKQKTNIYESTVKKDIEQLL
jgi:hypothetical protein